MYERSCSSIPSCIHFIWLGSAIPQHYLQSILAVAQVANTSHFAVNIWVDDKTHYRSALMLLKPQLFAQDLALAYAQMDKELGVTLRSIDELKVRMFGATADEFYQGLDDEFAQDHERAREFWHWVTLEMMGSNNWSAASNFLRYEILRQEGGYYFNVSTEFEHISPPFPPIPLPVCATLEQERRYAQLMQDYKKSLADYHTKQATMSHSPQFKADTPLLGALLHTDYTLSSDSSSNGIIGSIPNHWIFKKTLCLAIERYKTLATTMLTNEEKTFYHIKNIGIDADATIMDMKRFPNDTALWANSRHDASRYAVGVGALIDAVKAYDCYLLEKNIVDRHVCQLRANRGLGMKNNEVVDIAGIVVRAYSPIVWLTSPEKRLKSYTTDSLPQVHKQPTLPLARSAVCFFTPWKVKEIIQGKRDEQEQRRLDEEQQLRAENIKQRLSELDIPNPSDKTLGNLAQQRFTLAILNYLTADYFVAVSAADKEAFIEALCLHTSWANVDLFMTCLANLPITSRLLFLSNHIEKLTSNNIAHVFSLLDNTQHRQFFERYLSQIQDWAQFSWLGSIPDFDYLYKRACGQDWAIPVNFVLEHPNIITTTAQLQKTCQIFLKKNFGSRGRLIPLLEYHLDKLDNASILDLAIKYLSDSNGMSLLIEKIIDHIDQNRIKITDYAYFKLIIDYLWPAKRVSFILQHLATLKSVPIVTTAKQALHLVRAVQHDLDACYQIAQQLLTTINDLDGLNTVLDILPDDKRYFLVLSINNERQQAGQRLLPSSCLITDDERLAMAQQQITQLTTVKGMIELLQGLARQFNYLPKQRFELAMSRRDLITSGTYLSQILPHLAPEHRVTFASLHVHLIKGDQWRFVLARLSSNDDTRLAFVLRHKANTRTITIFELSCILSTLSKTSGLALLMQMPELMRTASADAFDDFNGYFEDFPKQQEQFQCYWHTLHEPGSNDNKH